MKQQIGDHFSYVIGILRCSQVLIIIGIILQATKIGEVPQGIVSLCIYLALLVVTIIGEKYLKGILKLEVIKEVQQLATIKDTMFVNTQIPVTIVENNGAIRWFNKAFSSICSEEIIAGKNIKEIISDIKVNEFSDIDTIPNKLISLGNRRFDVSIEKVEVTEDIVRPVYVLYFVETTENEILKQQINDERCMMGYLCIDNIDEITYSIEEVRRPMLLAIIDRKINLWFKEREVVITRVERDKYIMVFNRKELEKMEQTKFDILDEMRHIQVGNELPVTVSLGIGYNLSSLNNSKEDARIAFDLAQGRGGDQAIIKHHDKYTFYGGKTKEVEKSARVKVRIKAYAFKELLHEADKVFIMGHKGMDMDCLGAAMGVYRAAAIIGKKAQVILREPNFAIEALYDRIIPEDAEREIKKDTLLVVVDVHRKSYVECPELLDKFEKIVVFDHHRRSTDFIEDAVLTYVEPFISSTCEMISEILNYLTDKIKLTTIEADALLAGITIDTKNFVFKAGVRTFEAAAFLRRNGADSTRVRMLFQDDMHAYKARAAAIKDTEIWQGNMAISDVNSMVPHANIIAAQVADELLNIKGIEASFVLTPQEEYIVISARALKDVNVQRIMELLGGGGHLGIAGAQIKDVSLEQAKILLKDAINKYFEEGEMK